MWYYRKSSTVQPALWMIYGSITFISYVICSCRRHTWSSPFLSLVGPLTADLSIQNCWPYTVIRPPDIVCRRTYILPVFLLSFFLSFFRPQISEVAERNSTKIGHMVGRKCNLKTHVRNLGYPFPLQIGGPKTTFLGRLRNLRATLTAYIFGMKHDIDNRSSALTTTRGLLHCSKMSWTLVHKRLQTRPPFLPTLCKFCILLHCQASQTEISKQNSTTLCQTAGGKSR